MKGTYNTANDLSLGNPHTGVVVEVPKEDIDPMPIFAAIKEDLQCPSYIKIFQWRKVHQVHPTIGFITKNQFVDKSKDIGSSILQ